MQQYFVIYKPFDILSQFTREAPDHRTLSELMNFPPDVYPVGRLDRDSEGLLLITNDKTINSRLLDPRNGHQRTYWVQVEGEITPAAMSKLSQGVDIRVSKKTYRTKPAQARILTKEPELPPRNPPIRHRENVPTSWIQLRLKEGKNRQVRRMCAKVGFPVLRLVRVGIEKLELGGMKSGEVITMTKKEIIPLLNLPKVVKKKPSTPPKKKGARKKPTRKR